MPRPLELCSLATNGTQEPRTSSGTGIYHVMLRGINRQDIFEEQEDYQQFLIRLQNLVDPIDDNGEHIPSYFHVYAYCLMSNHVHLLLRERTESISISLKRLTVSCIAYYHTRRTGISYGVIQRIHGKMKLGQLKV